MPTRQTVIHNLWFPSRQFTVVNELFKMRLSDKHPYVLPESASLKECLCLSYLRRTPWFPSRPTSRSITPAKKRETRWNHPGFPIISSHFPAITLLSQLLFPFWGNQTIKWILWIEGKNRRNQFCNNESECQWNNRKFSKIYSIKNCDDPDSVTIAEGTFIFVVFHDLLYKGHSGRITVEMTKVQRNWKGTRCTG